MRLTVLMMVCLLGCGSDDDSSVDAGADSAWEPDVTVDVGSDSEPDVPEVDAGPDCGDGVVTPPEECDDGNPLDGDGCDNTCEFSCESSTDCDTGDPCLEASCVDHVCAQTFVDGDADGVSPFTCVDAELAGGDCDDEDDTIFPGQTDGCDDDVAIDIDCDGAFDEDGTTTEWFPDCDGDGFSTVESTSACTPPPADCPDTCRVGDEFVSCPGAWLPSAPASWEIDCQDQDARAFPVVLVEGDEGYDRDRAIELLTTMFDGEMDPANSFGLRHDFNCDGVEEITLLQPARECDSACTGLELCWLEEPICGEPTRICDRGTPGTTRVRCY